MFLIWLALIVAAFFVGHYAWTPVTNAVVAAWNWVKGLFVKKPVAPTPPTPPAA